VNFLCEALVVSSQQVQAFFDARRQALTSPEAFQNARQALLASDKTEVLAQFEARLQRTDEEERAETIAELKLLYGPEATDTIVRWMNDSSPIVRSVACTCLADNGDGRVVAALLDRLKDDADCQVRSIAANALGHIGAIESLPALHHAYRTDLEVDELGYTPSGHAEVAITSVLRSWVSRQIRGTPPRTFRESTQRGKLTGTVTAEAIPLDAEGGLNRTSRYSHLPYSSRRGGQTFIKMDLQTSLVDPFEIEVEYVDPIGVIQRILIYQRISDWDKFNWSVHTILDPTAMKSPPQP
jgi:hypothetical protein